MALRYTSCGGRAVTIAGLRPVVAFDPYPAAIHTSDAVRPDEPSWRVLLLQRQAQISGGGERQPTEPAPPHRTADPRRPARGARSRCGPLPTRPERGAAAEDRSASCQPDPAPPVLGRERVKGARDNAGSEPVRKNDSSSVGGGRYVGVRATGVWSGPGSESCGRGRESAFAAIEARIAAIKVRPNPCFTGFRRLRTGRRIQGS